MCLSFLLLGLIHCSCQQPAAWFSAAAPQALQPCITGLQHVAAVPAAAQLLSLRPVGQAHWLAFGVCHRRSFSVWWASAIPSVRFQGVWCVSRCVCGCEAFFLATIKSRANIPSKAQHTVRLVSAGAVAMFAFSKHLAASFCVAYYAWRRHSNRLPAMACESQGKGDQLNQCLFCAGCGAVCLIFFLPAQASGIVNGVRGEAAKSKGAEGVQG